MPQNTLWLISPVDLFESLWEETARNGVHAHLIYLWDFSPSWSTHLCSPELVYVSIVSLQPGLGNIVLFCISLIIWAFKCHLISLLTAGVLPFCSFASFSADSQHVFWLTCPIYHVDSNLWTVFDVLLLWHWFKDILFVLHFKISEMEWMLQLLRVIVNWGGAGGGIIIACAPITLVMVVLTSRTSVVLCTLVFKSADGKRNG